MTQIKAIEKIELEVPELRIQLISEERKPTSIHISTETKRLFDGLCRDTKKTQEEVMSIALYLYRQLVDKELKGKKK